MTKQEAMFQMALIEVGGNPALAKISHPKGECYYKGKVFPVIFPQAFVSKIDALKLLTTKVYDYSFRGVSTVKRQWVADYMSVSNVCISFTRRGRELLKQEFDETYYEQLCKTKFALCPSGDFTWTYRFFEACACRAIPIVDKECELMRGFKYYCNYDLDKAWVYDEEMVEHNYQLFRKGHVLSPEKLL